MKAVLNIYKDCSSEEPTKQYICRRLLYGASLKIQALSNDMEGKSEAEQHEINLDILKTIFPCFEDDDINYIDAVEWFEFVNEIGRETNTIAANAIKK